MILCVYCVLCVSVWERVYEGVCGGVWQYDTAVSAACVIFSSFFAGEDLCHLGCYLSAGGGRILGSGVRLPTYK